MFLNINTNQTPVEQDLDLKKLLILGAALERCSGSELTGLQLYFTGVFEDFGHIFPTCSKIFTKILKVGKIFRCVTSPYQHFFVSGKICYYKTSTSNINNSLTMISMRGELCDTFSRVGMPKLFCSFGVGFNSAFCGTFYFVKGLIKTEHSTLRFD